MSKDYYQRFRTLLSDTTIDDLLKKTVGYDESIEGKNEEVIKFWQLMK